ncbi:MAG: divalent metal cation transporter [Actinobacteria bacterium]|nr:divalent metal cation transporter [Actinomycetota bacterium]MCL5447407.1 divalent metal cation transporter [Actinomycetota bacterium]
MAVTPASSNIWSEPTGIADVDTACNKRARRFRWLRIALLAIWGPGLVVMLADTDVGSIVTSAQSGAEFGYRMVLPLLVLIPVLYAVQEMTVRLGIITGKGHGVLIREHFGLRWAMLSAGTLFLSSIGALLTEFAGIAGIGELFGISPMITVPVATAFLIGIAVTGSYRRTERVGIALGLAELAFVPAMLMAHPNLHAIGTALAQFPLHNGDYVKMLAANIGAVIMPWMIFYQQGAVIDKKLLPHHIRSERRDTAIGAILTQAIMIVVVLAFAATVGVTHPGIGLDTVGEMSSAMRPFFGHMGANIVLGVAVTGAALVGALVASLAGAWGMSEAWGWVHTLNGRPNRKTAKFYTVYSLAHILGAAVVLMGFNLVSLVIDVEVMNAFLLPIVLGFLLALEVRALPPEYRSSGVYRWVVTGLCLVVIAFGLYMVPVYLGWT